MEGKAFYSGLMGSSTFHYKEVRIRTLSCIFSSSAKGLALTLGAIKNDTAGNADLSLN